MILIATIVSGIVSVLVSVFVLKEYYRSRAIIYPINQGITDRSTLFSEKGESQVEYYGTKNDVNRLLEIASSSPIVDFLINHYKLAEHYNENKQSKYWRTKVKKKFMKNFSVIKTEREAIEISIMDTDPNLASEMVNMAVDKVDEHNKEPVVKNKLRIAARFKEDVEIKRQELDSITSKLNMLGKVYSINVKTDDKGNSMISGPSAEGVELYKTLQQQQQNVLVDFNKMSTLKSQYELSAKENVPSVYVVEKAYPAEKKDKPVRWLICSFSVVITFLLSVLAALLFEQLQFIRQELKNA